MSKRQRLRKEKRLIERKEEFQKWRAQKNLYKVPFPWKKLFLTLGGTVIVLALVWVSPKIWTWGANLIASTKDITGPFGTLSREEFKKDKYVTLVTSEGNIKFQLLGDSAPNAVANFILLAKKNFYNDIKFHRVIKDFMIQTGDPLSKDNNPDNDGTGGPGYTFKDEFNAKTPKLVRGIVAMANSGADTNGSQFFIIKQDATSWLDGKHTPFGKVVEGLDIVDKIDNAKTDSKTDKPIKDIIIKQVILSES